MESLRSKFSSSLQAERHTRCVVIGLTHIMERNDHGKI